MEYTREERQKDLSSVMSQALIGKQFKEKVLKQVKTIKSVLNKKEIKRLFKEIMSEI